MAQGPSQPTAKDAAVRDLGPAGPASVAGCPDAARASAGHCADARDTDLHRHEPLPSKLHAALRVVQCGGEDADLAACCWAA